MKRLTPWFFFLLASPAVADETVALSIGRSITWEIAATDEVTVSNGAVIRVVDRGFGIKITGVKLGQAVVKTRTKTLEVSVLPEAGYRLYERLRAAVDGKRGLEIDVRSGSLEIGGRLLRWSDWLELSRAMKVAGDNSFRFSAAIDPAIRESVLRGLSEEVRAAGLALPDFRFEPNAAAYVPMEPKDLKERMSNVLSPFGFHVVATSGVVDLAPMVRVKIVVAEFRKKAMSRIGLKWPAAISGQLLPSPQSDDKLPLSFDALEENGLGKVLASPTLLCRSGKEAEFLAGGEFPIKIANFKSHDVVWKKYGVLLKVKPLADRAGRMSIMITTEVSALDRAQAVDGLPGLLTNRIETHFDLTSTRTIALSGLIKKEWGESIQGLPGLSRLPVLGPLFSSRDYANQETELVIFVTPELEKEDR